MRGRAFSFTPQRAGRRPAALARNGMRLDAGRACALARALALAGERHAGAARFRQTDGYRLLGRARTVFSLADVLHLLADEFTRHGAGGLALTSLSTRAFEGAFFGHGVSFRRVASAPLWPPRAPCAASSTGLCRRD